MSPESNIEPASTSTPSPFKRAALPTLAGPLVALRPPSDSAAGVTEPPSTLLFNDLSDDALMCDPNDPDCELV